MEPLPRGAHPCQQPLLQGQHCCLLSSGLSRLTRTHSAPWRERPAPPVHLERSRPHVGSSSIPRPGLCPLGGILPPRGQGDPDTPTSTPPTSLPCPRRPRVPTCSSLSDSAHDPGLLPFPLASVLSTGEESSADSGAFLLWATAVPPPGTAQQGGWAAALSSAWGHHLRPWASWGWEGPSRPGPARPWDHAASPQV